LNRLKIQLFTNLFAPDELAGAALFTDLALYLTEQGADVRVATTYSYYPAWKVDLEDARHACRDEMWEGIPVRRIRMHVPAKPTGAGRLLSDLSFLLGLLRFATSRDWTPDVVVTASPMFSQCLAQRFLYRGKNVPRLIIVQDFVVDAALELGILKLPGLAGLLRGLERWSFRSAQTLTTISEPMLGKLRGIVGNNRRAVLIPNWIHASLQQEINRQAASQPKRKPKTLFYSGNVGVKQGLPDFITTFTAANTGWQLRINGGGAQRGALEQSVKGRQDVALGGVLSEADYVQALLTSAACLVTQAPGVGANFLPSKLLPAMAAGTPVLAVCDERSPLGREVMEGGFGEVVPAGNAEQLAAVLQRWADDDRLLSELGAKARQRSVRFERSAVLGLYWEEIRRLAGVVARAPVIHATA
jgi:colanic acid biosynthesis glycosyl transferase WcaI